MPFEKVRETGAEIPPSSECWKVLEEKAEETVNKMVGEKLDQYFQERIKSADLEKIATQVFGAALKGADETQMTKIRRNLLAELLRERL